MKHVPTPEKAIADALAVAIVLGIAGCLFMGIRILTYSTVAEKAGITIETTVAEETETTEPTTTEEVENIETTVAEETETTEPTTTEEVENIETTADKEVETTESTVAEETETTEPTTAEEVGITIEPTTAEEVENAEDFDVVKWYRSLTEIDQMAHLIEGEAGDQDDDCQLAVGTVIMNRIDSWQYPDTIADVVLEVGPVQYACAWDGNIQKIPSERAYQNAQSILKGTRTLDSDYVYQAQFEQGWDCFWLGSECFGRQEQKNVRVTSHFFLYNENIDTIYYL